MQEASFGDFWRFLAIFGHFWPFFSLFWPNFGTFWAILGKFLPNLSRFEVFNDAFRCLVLFGMVWSRF